MENRMLNEEMIREKLALIVQEIGNIEISDGENSLFSLEYNLSSESFIYILLRASKEFCFEINDAFINSLGNYSFQCLVSSIKSQIASQLAYQ